MPGDNNGYRSQEGVPIAIDSTPCKPDRCQQGKCPHKHVAGIRYPWGCVSLCRKHLDAELAHSPNLEVLRA